MFIVVGAGVIGCAVAHALAARGAAVRLIDPRAPGQGATRASAGILAPQIEGHVPALHALAAASLSLYDRFIADVTADAGGEVEYERTGTLQVALSEAERSELCGAARTLRQAGVAHRMLDGGEARSLEPALTPDTVGALLIDGQGYVAAGALMRALRTAAVARGAEIVAARVTALEGGSRPRVITEAGPMSGDAVVVAAGSWSSSGGLAVPESAAVTPIRGQLVQLGAGARAAGRVVWGRDCYLVPWRDGTTLAGATVEDVGFDESPTAAGVARLLTAAAALVPALGAAAFQEVRVGLRPRTRDELPAIGASSTMRGVYYATGHYRNGVLLAPLTAALVAGLLIDQREAPELAVVRPARLGL